MSRIIWATTLSIALTTAHIANAVNTSVWRVNTSEGFEKGEAEGLTISSDGELSLAPALDDFAETDDLFIWSMVEGPDGTVYAGTGNNGRVYSVTPAGSTEVFFDSPQSEIHSLAVDKDGTIYAGAAPDGVIYKIDPQGQGEVFCYTGESYIWALAIRERGGLYAATGAGGLVLKIGRDGRIAREPILNSRDPHVMTLISDGSGGLYAGTDGSGLVYHIDSEERARILFDGEEEEIHRLALDSDGSVFAAAVTSRSRPIRGSPKEKKGSRPRSAVLYRIQPTGVATKLWEAPQPLMLSLLPYGDGTVLAGLAHRGWLYSIDREGLATRVADAGESHALSMLRRRGGDVLLGMGNSGKIKRLTANPGRTGTWTSQVHDAEIISQWGRLSTRHDAPRGTSVSIETRTGNNEDPKEGWLAWTKLGGEGRTVVTSPPGRFMQIKVTLNRRENSRSPQLSEVAVAGRQVNVAPQVRDIRISTYRTPPRTQVGPQPPKSSSNGNNSSKASRVSSSPGRRLASPTLRNVQWTATDPNEDKLSYRLYLKGAGERQWKLLTDDLTSTRYLWDIESAPEGTMQIKVAASDELVNPAELALETEEISTPFFVDHTGPTIEGLKADVSEGTEVVISGLLRDRATFVHKGQYSLDGGDWQMFAPSDGIFDSPSERFRFPLGDLAAGEHTLVIKTTDVESNVGTASVVFQVLE